MSNKREYCSCRNWRYAAVSAIEYIDAGDHDEARDMLQSALALSGESSAPSAPVGVGVSGYIATVPDNCDRIIWRGRYYHLPLAQQPAARPAITHCDNCGCDWLDNGLNPIGCPYCKQLAAVDEVVCPNCERPTEIRHCQACGCDFIAGQQPAACGTCEPDGVFDTEGNGPFDCYACGKKAQQPTVDDRICSVCDGGPGNDGPCLCGERRWEQPAAEAQRCTCPSGDGSLRWPCPVHPPSAPVAFGEISDASIKWDMRHIEPHLKDEEAAIPVLLQGVRKAIKRALAQQYVAVHEAAPNSAVAAIQFALSDSEGMLFLQLWSDGEFDTIRSEWPDAPAEVYIDANHLAGQQQGGAA